MKIEIKSIDECIDLLNIVDKVKNMDNITNVVSEIISATDRFRIQDSFELIGPMKCSKCYKNWTAILSRKAKEVPCPRCGNMNEICV